MSCSVPNSTSTPPGRRSGPCALLLLLLTLCSWTSHARAHWPFDLPGSTSGCSHHHHYRRHLLQQQAAGGGTQPPARPPPARPPPSTQQITRSFTNACNAQQLARFGGANSTNVKGHSLVINGGRLLALDAPGTRLSNASLWIQNGVIKQVRLCGVGAVCIVL